MSFRRRDDALGVDRQAGDSSGGVNLNRIFTVAAFRAGVECSAEPALPVVLSLRGIALGCSRNFTAAQESYRP